MPGIVITFVLNFVPMIIPFLISYLYSWAILRAIASARDVHHRMTPQSPWVYFDREFKPRYHRLLGFLIPWSLLGFIVQNASIIWEGGKVYWDLQSLAVYCLTFMSFTGFSWAFITQSAPIFARPEALAVSGLIVGWLMLVPLALGFNWIVDVMIWEDNRADPIIGFIFLFIGMTSYSIAWRHVRRRLDRAWFRFDV